MEEKNDKKRIFIQFEVSKEEKESIQDYAKNELHITMSAFIRSAIFKEIKGLTTSPGQTINNEKINTILEMMKKSEQKTQVLEKQNMLLTKMYKMVLDVKARTNNIPAKTETETLNLIIKTIENHRARIGYKYNKTPMLTRDIILKTKLPQKDIVPILIKNQNKIFKQIGKGWDIIDIDK